MENHFAGSRNQSERRRRHLASDHRDVAEGEVDSDMLAEFSAQDVLKQGRIASPQTIGVLSRLVPRAAWPYPVLLIVVAGCLIALYAHGGASLTQNLAGLLLLLTGQLAIFISLIRETSDIDFRGRFRWWRWLGVTGFVTAILMLTHTLADVPGLIATVVAELTGPVHAARPALVVVPCVACSIVLLGRIIPDMSRCRCSQTLFVAATLTAIIRQMLIYTDNGDIAATRSLDMLLISASYLAFAALVVHSRFVAYVCNDPPAAGVLPPRSQKPPETEKTADKDGPNSVDVSPAEAKTETSTAKNTDETHKAKSSPKRKGKRSARRSRKKAA